MKEQLQAAVMAALELLNKEGVISTLPESLQIERVKQKQHGDFACNIAMVLAKRAGMSPRLLAQKICQYLPEVDVIEHVDIAGPGFINFYVQADSQQSVVKTVLDQKSQYGCVVLSESAKKIHLEFVSANPTGPLHVGHGRGAAHGSALANLLRAAGHRVHCEYYVNDAGRQMDILALSVWLRYLALAGVEYDFPDKAYQGAYIKEIAQSIYDQYGQQFCLATSEELGAAVGSVDSSDSEAYLDALIAYCKVQLGEDYQLVHGAGLQAVLGDIKQDLAEFGVCFDQWFSEQSLVDNGSLSAALERLGEAGLLYQQSGATWFKSTEFGDDKDRVVVRDNGQATYFASDAAYMLNKFSRGFDEIICVFGADHHGYVPRLNALMQAFGYPVSRLVVPLVQFAVLYRGGKQVQMSTRSGSFVTLRELRQEVGTDAARLFYLMRRCEQHLDFDLDLAKSQTNENPVYYIQYAHARICSVFQQLAAKSYQYDQQAGLASLDLLQQDNEQALLTQLVKFPEIIQLAAAKLEPHLLVYYLRDLATVFHGYYNQQVFLVESDQARNVRLCLIDAVRQVLSNGLGLLGLSAPEKM